MILYDSEMIRGKIKSVLAAKNGRRYALVAFVGQDALDFVHEPKGLIVYCWPNVAATNPDGVKDLISKGASVYFVERLHMKLFWSESGGAVVGSCNLTHNALGGGPSSLWELAYHTSDSSEIEIDDILKKLEASRQPVTRSVLSAYRNKYNLAAARRDETKHGAPKQKLKTFSDFLRQPQGDQKIITTVYYGYDEKTPKAYIDAVRKSEELSGRDPEKFIRDYVLCEIQPKPGTWVLHCKIGVNGSYGLLGWLFTHLKAKPRINSTNWAAIELKKSTEAPPFDCRDKNFVAGFKAFSNEVGLVNHEALTLTPARFARIAELSKSLT